MSEAPAREPNLRVSSLMRSLRMSDLQRLPLSVKAFDRYSERTYFDTAGAPEPSGNGTSSLKILAKVALRFLPLKGVVP
jgi:hypothetical protein